MAEEDKKAELSFEDKERYKGNIALRSYSIGQFDRQVIYISGGGLGLSIVFLQQLIDPSKATLFCLLFLSWLAFIVSLLANLMSQQYAISSIDYDIQGEDEKSTAMDNKVGLFNNTSLCTMLLGLLFFVIFVAVNFSKGAFKKDTDSNKTVIINTMGKDTTKDSKPTNTDKGTFGGQKIPKPQKPATGTSK